MIINSSDFVIGAVGEKQYPSTGLSEIALCGRSNVGKSSFINKIIQRKNLARTSGKPGKTQQLNYYFIKNDHKDFYFVDLPGYGYAKSSKSTRAKWGEFIENYLSNRDKLVAVFQIIDIRHEPTKDDIMMHEWLRYNHKNVIIIATKADKISKGSRQRQIHVIKKCLNYDFEPFIFSATTGYGRDNVLEFIEDIL